jgi:hypothetical protein
MQQRQPRLGDILDDYCPRERRLTNHAVVAMVGDDVKQTRCTTCDAEHEYKHARVPRQRRKADAPAALYNQVAAAAPKRVTPEHLPDAGEGEEPVESIEPAGTIEESVPMLAAERAGDPAADADTDPDATPSEEDTAAAAEEGPVHRPLIRATLPRTEGQPPPVRPAPEFTIRQPGGRPNRFRRPQQRGGQQFMSGRNGNVAGGHMRGGGMGRPGGGRPAMNSRPPRRHGPGGKRSK